MFFIKKTKIYKYRKGNKTAYMLKKLIALSANVNNYMHIDTQKMKTTIMITVMCRRSAN